MVQFNHTMNPQQQNGQYPSTPPVHPPAPQPGTPGHDPYDFILNPQRPAKPPVRLLPTGNSTLQRVAIAGGGLVVLIILFAIVASILGNSGKSGTTGITTVAQEQTELARIATDGVLNATSPTAQNLASTVQVTMTSAQAQTVAYLTSTGHKLSTKTLALKQSATTDTTLQNAKAASTYDAAFTTIIQSELTSYETSLRTAFVAKPGPKGQALLQSQFNAAKLLDTLSHQQ